MQPEPGFLETKEVAGKDKKTIFLETTIKTELIRKETLKWRPLKARKAGLNA
jgi:hypothetical protein